MMRAAYAAWDEGRRGRRRYGWRRYGWRAGTRAAEDGGAAGGVGHVCRRGGGDMMILPMRLG
ncbi:MAG: hypothetical protein ACRDOD_24150 [Streptosporangiaceae bacterium]